MGQHNVRVDDGLWSAAFAKARGEGRTITDVVTDALRSYAGEPVLGIYVIPDPELPPGTVELRAPGLPPLRVTNIAPEPPALEKCPHLKADRIKGRCSRCRTFVGY